MSILKMTLTLFSDLSQEDKNFVVKELTRGKCRPRLNSKSHDVFPVKFLQKKVQKLLGVRVRNMTRADLCSLLFDYRRLNKNMIDEEFHLNDLQRQLRQREDEIEALKKRSSPSKQIDTKVKLTKKQLLQARKTIDDQDKEISKLKKIISELKKDLKNADSPLEIDEIEQEQEVIQDRVDELEQERKSMVKNIKKLTQSNNKKNRKIEDLEDMIRELEENPRGSTATKAAAAGVLGAGALAFAERSRLAKRIADLEQKLKASQQTPVKTESGAVNVKPDPQLITALQKTAARLAEMTQMKSDLEKALEKQKSFAQEEIARLAEENNELTDAMTSLRNQIQDPAGNPVPNNILDGFKERIKDRDQKIRKLEEEIIVLEKAKQEAEEKLREANLQIEKLRAEVGTVEKDIRTDAEKTGSVIASLEEKKEVVGEKIAADTRELERLQEQVRSQASEIQLKNSRIQQLEQEKQQAIAMRDREIQTLRMQIGSLNQRIMQVEGMRQQFQQQIPTVGPSINMAMQQARQQIQAAEQERDRVRASVQQELNQLRRQVAERDARLQEKEAQLSRLQQRLSEEKESLRARFNEELQRKESEIRKLSSEIMSLNNKIQKLEAAAATAATAAATVAATAPSAASAPIPPPVPEESRKVVRLLKKKQELEARLGEKQNVQELKQNISQINQELKEIEKKSPGRIQKLASELKQFSRRNSNDKLQQLTSELAKKESEISDLRAKLSERDSKIIDTEKRLQGIVNESKLLKKQQQELTQQLSKAESELSVESSRLQGLLKQKDAEIATLTSRIDRLMQAQASGQPINLSNELAAAEAKVSASEKTFADLKAQLELKNAALERIERAREMADEKFRKQLQEKNQEFQKIESKLNKLQEEKQSHDKILAEKDKQIKQLQDRLETTAAVASPDTTAEIQSLKNQLAEKEKELSDLENIITELRNTAQDPAGAAAATVPATGKTGPLSELLTQQKQLIKKDSELKRAIAAKENISEAREAKLKQAEEQAKQLQEKLIESDKKAQEQIAEGTKQIQKLSEELQSVKAELENAKNMLETEKRRSQDEINIKNDRIAALEKDISDLKQIKPGQIVETGIDESIVKQKDAIIDKLQARIQELEANLGKELGKIAALEQRIKNEQDQFESRLQEKEKTITALETRLKVLTELQTQINTLTETVSKQAEEKKENLQKIASMTTELEQLRETVKSTSELQSRITELEQEIEKEQNRNTQLESSLKTVRAQTQEEIDKRVAELQEKLRQSQEDAKKADENAAKAIMTECERDLSELQSELSSLKDSILSARDTVRKLSNLTKAQTDNIRNAKARRNITSRGKYVNEKELINKVATVAEKQDLQIPDDCDDIKSGLAVLKENKKNLLKTIDRVQNDWEDFNGVGRVYLRMKGQVPGTNPNMKYAKKDGNTVILKNTGRCVVRDNTFGPYTRVFGPTTGNKDIFNEMRSVIEQISTGYRVVVFTYGQTGAGKSYTLMGGENDLGVVQRSLAVLANMKDEIESMHISARQIYKDIIYDVFKMKHPLPKITGAKPGRETKSFPLDKETEAILKSGSTAPSIMPLFTKGEPAKSMRNRFKKYFNTIQQRRPTRQTDANPESSRSHLFITITITFTDKVAKRVGRKQTQLTFVDVAGNEDFAAAVGESRAEGRAIVSTLGTMIETLVEYAEGTKQQNQAITSGKTKALVEDVIDVKETNLLTKVIMFLNTHTYFVNEKTDTDKQVNDRICTTTANTLNIGNKLMKLGEKARPFVKK